MSRYSDQDHVTAWMQTGRFPAIHDDIAHLIRENVTIQGAALDVGSCTGLLSVQLREMGFSDVLGIEPNKTNYTRAVPWDRVTYSHAAVHDDILAEMRNWIMGMNVSLVVCRRVLPEIEESCDGLVERFAKALFGSGVKYLAIEGRVPVAKHSAKLWNVELEVNAVKGYFGCIAKHKHCRLLESRT